MILSYIIYEYVKYSTYVHTSGKSRVRHDCSNIIFPGLKENNEDFRYLILAFVVPETYIYCQHRDCFLLKKGMFSILNVFKIIPVII